MHSIAVTLPKLLTLTLILTLIAGNAIFAAPQPTDPGEQTSSESIEELVVFGRNTDHGNREA